MEHLKAILAQLGDGAYILDKQGNAIFVNHTACTLLGYPQEALIGQDLHALIHYQDEWKNPLPKEACPIHQSLKEARDCQEVETVFWTNERKPLYVIATATAVTLEDKQQITVTTFKNVTRQIKRLREVQSAAEYFQHLFENAPLPYQSLDREGRIQSVNRLWLETMGYTDKEAVLHRWFGDFLSPQEQTPFKEALTTLQNEGGMLATHYHLVRRDGSAIVCHFTGRVHYGSDRQITGIHCVFQDVTEQTQLRRELQESVERLNLVVSSVAAIVYTLDTQGRFTALYGPWPKGFGMSADTLLGKTPRDILGPELATGHEAAHADVLKGETVTYDWQAPLFGETRHFRTVLAPIRDREERITGMVATGVDITETIQLKEALETSEIRYRSIFENAMDGMLLVDNDMRFIDANHQASKILHTPKEQLPGKNGWDFYRGENIDKSRGDWERLRANSADYQGHTTLLLNDETRTINYKFTMNILPGKHLVVFEDITKEMADRESLIDHSRMLQEVMDHTNNGIAVYQPDARCREFTFVDINRPGEILSNARKEEIVGQPLLTMFPMAKEMGLLEILERVCESGEPEYLPMRHYQDEKRDQWVTNYVFKIPGGQVVALYHDVTTEKMSQVELEKINKTLQKQIDVEVEKRQAQERMTLHSMRLAAIGEIVHNIAHHWRQPLNALGLLIQDLEDAYEHHEVTPEYIGRTVKRSMSLVSEMSGTIEQFRSFFKESNHREEFSVGHAIYDTLVLLNQEATTQQIDIIFNCCKEGCYQRFDNREGFACLHSPLLLGYANELKQVLVGLVNNAIEAIHRRIFLGHMHPGEGKIIVNLTQDDTTLQITIEDNGGGVLPSLGEKIFEPYVSTKEQSHGVGLGLYMAKTLIEGQMEGRLAYIPIPGGSRFTITLPKKG